MSKNKFEITSIRIHKLPKSEDSNIVGIASIVLNNAFLVNDIRVIQGKEKLFCGMPSRRLEDKSFMDICHPLNNEVRQYLENLVLAEYINAEEENEDSKNE